MARMDVKTGKIFALRKEPGEQQVSVYFRKQTGPEGKEGTTGVILRCKGGNKSITALIDVLNKAVPGDECPKTKK